MTRAGDEIEAAARLVAGVPEKALEELVYRLELDDPKKATRNAAWAGLAGGSVGAALLAREAGVIELFNPLATLSLFVMLTVGLPFAWRLGDIDVRVAVWMWALHRRVFVRRHERSGRAVAPSYFRIRVETDVTPWQTAKMAFEPYSLSLTVGIIAWSMAIGIAPGGEPITAPSAVLAMGIALASMGATLGVTWVIPPLWLLRTAGVRAHLPSQGVVQSVDHWYLAVLAPLMGVAALGTLFIVYAIGGLSFRPAILSFITISVALYPIAFASTYLYRVTREGRAAAEVAYLLRREGIRSYAGVPEAMASANRPVERRG